MSLFHLVQSIQRVFLKPGVDYYFGAQQVHVQVPEKVPLKFIPFAAYDPFETGIGSTVWFLPYLAP